MGAWARASVLKAKAMAAERDLLKAFIVSPFKASSGPVFLLCGWMPHALK
jgi:hypothetical protein